MATSASRVARVSANWSASVAMLSLLVWSIVWFGNTGLCRQRRDAYDFMPLSLSV